jgi:hypothetical protein
MHQPSEPSRLAIFNTGCACETQGIENGHIEGQSVFSAGEIAAAAYKAPGPVPVTKVCPYRHTNVGHTDAEIDVVPQSAGFVDSSWEIPAPTN